MFMYMFLVFAVAMRVDALGFISVAACREALIIPMSCGKQSAGSGNQSPSNQQRS